MKAASHAFTRGHITGLYTCTGIVPHLYTSGLNARSYLAYYAHSGSCTYVALHTSRITERTHSRTVRDHEAYTGPYPRLTSRALRMGLFALQLKADCPDSVSFLPGLTGP